MSKEDDAVNADSSLADHLIENFRRVTEWLDLLGVPKVVEINGTAVPEGPSARLSWFVIRSMRREIAERLEEYVRDEEKTAKHLKVLAGIYETDHSNDQHRATQPWAAVRWSKRKT